MLQLNQQLKQTSSASTEAFQQHGLFAGNAACARSLSPGPAPWSGVPAHLQTAPRWATSIVGQCGFPYTQLG